MPLTEQTLLNQIAAGEDSGRRFKRDAHNAESPAGADKRRVNSKEELRRLFRISAQFHAD